MIIKIMKPNRVDFWMCDNVENIHVEQIRTFTNQSAPPDQGPTVTESVVCSIYDDSDRPKVSCPWSISFKKRNDDERYVAMFDTMAYICNDNGQTVERISG